MGQYCQFMTVSSSSLLSLCCPGNKTTSLGSKTIMKVNSEEKREAEVERK